ncbi:hypothetical protein D9758_005031 [Tetrapyrgos nigripes]|uniref:Zn(2)-C6 fungal-type domain-containing protein n=1 Tax=Tetrapyrgos nigripes TaxID=182062 RepID=A0A8H5LWH0_9AGAR|nr:hypothetical protein D9758_005031 [Tetrapyrgos nigripes]
MYAGSSHSSRILPTKPLKRGKACLTCRFLKIKCDGGRPICGPCERHPKDDPCEYADGPGRSRTRQLEETVSRLEARLREYENPNETPAVTLSNPYDGSESDSTLGVNLTLQPISRYPTDTSTYSPSSQYSIASPASSSSTPRSSAAPPSTRTTSESPTSDNNLAIRNLLDVFFTHASSFGFFLNVSRFYNAATQPSSFTFPTRPCSALLSTVLLCGFHLSPADYPNRSPVRDSSSSSRSQTQTQKQEHEYLLRALRDTAVELCSISHGEVNPYPMQRSLMLQTIQAEVLLSHYFFRTANITEAKRHASSAASLALASNLHRVWPTSTASTPPTPGTQASSYPGVTGAGPDAVEEGERINGFWAVFVLYRNLAVAVDPPSEVCGVFDAPGMQIDTPWPLDMENYKESILPEPGSSTVWNYLNHVQTSADGPYSTHNLLAKSSILLHQATFLEGQYYPTMSERDSQSFSAAFQSLNHLIESLGSHLPPLSTQSSRIDPTNPTTRLLFHAHSMLHGATIKLHGLFAYSDPTSRQVCVAAAKAMIAAGGMNVQEFGCVNPIMGVSYRFLLLILFILPVLRTRELTFSFLRSTDSLDSRLPGLN